MSTRNIIILTFLTIFLAAQLGPGAVNAGGAILIVPQSYVSVQAALNSAQPGDTIQVNNGTYSEKLYIINRNNLTIIGDGNELSRIVNQYSKSDDRPSIYVENSTNITVRDLGFDGGDTGIVVTENSDVSVQGCSLENFVNVGIFVGKIPCAPLPAGSLKVPDCYLWDRAAYVDSSSLEFINSYVEDNGVNGVSGTGLVFFAGTSGLIRNSFINRNKLTGIFVWGARVDVDGCTFIRNVEHALEYRQYPSPKKKKGLLLRAGGTLTNNTIKDTLPLPGNFLGGGMVTQAADMILTGNTIEANATWGISACRKSYLTLNGNSIINNGHAGVILQKGSRGVFEAGNTISGNSYEGLIVQGNGFAELTSATIKNNGRFGILCQKKSEGHLLSSIVSGNGQSGDYYGGIAFWGKSWGSIVNSDISGHNNGPGILYYGGPKELFIEDNDISSNKRSGVVFDGWSAVGSVVRNTFTQNQPAAADCPNTGRPYFGSPNDNQFINNGKNIDAGCGSPPDQFLVIPAETSVNVLSSSKVGYRKFANKISSSLPMVAGRTMTGPAGVAGVSASPSKAKKWYLPGGTTENDMDTKIVVFNPTSRAKVEFTFYPESGTPITVSRIIKKNKRKIVSASAVIGNGYKFSTKVYSKKAVVPEQQVVTPQDLSAARGDKTISASWYFAGGDVSSGVDTVVSVHNPSDLNANLTFKYLLGTGISDTKFHLVTAYSGSSFSAADDLSPYEGPFALYITSDQEVSVSMMATDSGGVKGCLGTVDAATEWYLPGGTTSGGNEAYIHLANPGTALVQTTLSFHVGNPGVETSVPVDISAGDIVTLQASSYVGYGADYGLSVSANGPVITSESVEYSNLQKTASTAVAEDGYRWYLADGLTSELDETILHLYNPNPDPLTIRLLYNYSH